MALNRAGRGDEAETALTALIDERGPSSETYGLLGRVYKDRWDAAKKADDLAAPAWAEKAINAYLKGFEADWRDAYPGINAVTLMALTDPEDERIAKLAPVVRYAVERKIARGAPDYWDFATLVELAVIAGDMKEAKKLLPQALVHLTEGWNAETTARNLEPHPRGLARRREGRRQAQRDHRGAGEAVEVRAFKSRSRSAALSALSAAAPAPRGAWIEPCRNCLRAVPKREKIARTPFL